MDRARPLAGLLPLVLWAGSAAGAEEPRSCASIVSLGVYDLATGTLLGAGAEGEPLVGDLVFDNSDDSANQYYAPSSGFLDLDTVVLSAGGKNAITAIGFGYATTIVGTVDLDLRLNRSSSDLTDPGEGVLIPLRGLPGAVSAGQALGYTLLVQLVRPIVVPDGPIRIGYQTFDAVTGPILVKVNAAVGDTNRLRRYDLAGKYQYEFFFSSSTIASVYAQLYGIVPSFPKGEVLDGRVARSDLLQGALDAGETDRYRYHGLAGERLHLRLDAQDAFSPRLALRATDGGAVLGSAEAEEGGTATFEVEALPVTGIYRLDISAEEPAGVGAYRLGVRGKPPGGATKLLPAPAFPTLLVFTAEEGALLTVIVRAAPGSLPPTASALSLQGPQGEVDLQPYATEKSSRLLLRKVPLPAVGAYELRSLTEGAAAPSAKGRLALPRARSVLDELEQELVGTWLRDEFITNFSNSHLTLDARGAKGQSSRFVRVTGPYTITRSYSKWSVDPSESFENEQRKFARRVRQPIEVLGSPPLVLQGEPSMAIDHYRHPLGDAETVEFVESGEVWRLDATQGPPPPEVLAALTSALGNPAAAGGQRVLRLVGPAEAAAFEIFRAAPGTVMPPSYPSDRQPALAGAALWIDPGTPGAARYWVRSLDQAGTRGPFGAPLDVAP